MWNCVCIMWKFHTCFELLTLNELIISILILFVLCFLNIKCHLFFCFFNAVKTNTNHLYYNTLKNLLMKKIILFSCLAFLLSFQSIVAQSITGKVIDEQQLPVAYVSIQIGSTYGVVSNTEGDFIINIPEKTDSDKVIFSCIGFENLEIPISDFKNGTYTLKEKVNVLDDVFITNKKLTPIEILTEVIKNAPKNYSVPTEKQTFFLRSSFKNKMIDSKFKLVKSSLEKKSTLKEINKDLENNSKKFINQSSNYYSESYGFLYEQNNTAKLLVEKAIELKNKEKDISGEQINKKLIEVMKKHLEPDATYKVKSGLFPIDDSLKIDNPKKEIKTGVKTASLRNEITSLSTSLNKFYTNKDLDFLTEYKRYSYTLEGYSSFNDESIYIIDFKPEKSSAKYFGKIYISTSDYAIVKLDYNLADGEVEDKLNLKLLLGVKMIEDKVKVAATFSKNETGQYAVNFVKKEKRIYMYMNRPLKFTKNKVDKKEETRMLKIDILAEVETYSTNELFIIDRQAISNEEFKNFTEKEKYDINYLSKYDASVWKNYNILAPVEAIKNYN